MNRTQFAHNIQKYNRFSKHSKQQSIYFLQQQRKRVDTLFRQFLGFNSFLINFRLRNITVNKMALASTIQKPTIEIKPYMFDSVVVRVKYSVSLTVGSDGTYAKRQNLSFCGLLLLTRVRPVILHP